MTFLQFRDPLSGVDFLVLELFRIVSVGGGKAGGWKWGYGQNLERDNQT